MNRPNVKPILLVEDSPADAELVLEALERCHLANNVVHVRDGVEALDYLRCTGEFKHRGGGEPVVVLLDLKLPRLSGPDVLRAIRADPVLQHTPVVMLTSSREERDLIQTYQLGVNAYVVKPVDFAAFVAAVRDLGMFWALLNELPPRPAPT